VLIALVPFCLHVFRYLGHVVRFTLFASQSALHSVCFTKSRHKSCLDMLLSLASLRVQGWFFGQCQRFPDLALPNSKESRVGQWQAKNFSDIAAKSRSCACRRAKLITIKEGERTCRKGQRLGALRCVLAKF